MKKILIAHPGKHHALHLVAGCVKSGAEVTYATPFYQKGLGRLISLIPGFVGHKASGYTHALIKPQIVYSPIFWQMKKLYSMFRNNLEYEKSFDQFVSKLIVKKKLKMDILVTLQDYMPETVRAAKKSGFKIWSDQILNQSQAVFPRINKHEKLLGVNSVWKHDESLNREIISNADYVTYPSSYCYEGISDSIQAEAKILSIPYGADHKNFSGLRDVSENEIVLLARAQSLRKGGHLLLMALEKCGEQLLRYSDGMNIRVVVLGEFEPALVSLLSTISLPKELIVEHANVPHSSVPSLLQKSSLFIMPSLSESMSLACVEAMHAQLPLIITSYCGIDGFVNGKMGFVIDDNVQSLINALVDAFKNRHMWSCWGKNAKQFAEELTWDKYEDRVAEFARKFIL